MLNPAHALVGKHCHNKAMADAFTKWLKRPDGGQKVISGFEQNGTVLYTPAPLEKGPSML